MEYVSTRGKAKERTFSDIAFEGFAEDNGLWVPKSIPKVNLQTLRTWKGLSYASLAFEILHLFAPEIPRKDMWRLCADAYDPSLYPYSRDIFNIDEVTPITWLHDNVGLLELSTGPTLAFDDISMKFLAGLFDMGLTDSHPTTLLGATTGDMGISAEKAFGNHENIDVIMLSPRDRMSRFQAAQLFSNKDDNVTNIEIDGTFDDCQDIVTKILQDRAWSGERNIGAINSVLFARIATQVVYYFYGYLHAVDRVGEEICFVMPGGNFGNAYAGWLAKEMGLPIMRLIVGTNENDTMDAFLRTGHYAPRPSSETIATTSPSTDISRAASFERFLFEILKHDGARVAELMSELEEKGEFRLTHEELRSVRRSGVVSGSSNHANRLEIIESMHLEFDTYVDPHAADALFCGIYLHPVGIKTLVCETVQAVKFPKMVRQATGCTVPPPDELADIFEREQRSIKLPADEGLVRQQIDRILAKKAQNA